MKPADRFEWILAYLRARHPLSSVNVLDRYFSDAYIRATEAKFEATMLGANKCTQLGRDLAAMHRAGMLRRRTAGIEGFAGMGFPRWVWDYQLPKVNT